MKDVGEPAQVDPLKAEQCCSEAGQHPVQREGDRPQLDRTEGQGNRQHHAESQQQKAGLQDEEVRAVDEHCAQVDPSCVPRREPAAALVVAEPPFAVLEESDRHLGGAQLEVHRLEHHLRRILPGLRLQLEALQRIAGDPAHAAMDVGEVARVENVQDPGRDWRPQIAVQRWHRTGLDVAAEPRAHHELEPRAELLDECDQLAEVVRAVRVAHEHVLAADVRQGIDVGAAQAALGRLEHARAARQRDLPGPVVAAVDDQHLTCDSGLGEARLAPVDEIPDRQLLVQGRDDDRNLRTLDVPIRNQKPDLGILAGGGELAQFVGNPGRHRGVSTRQPGADQLEPGTTTPVFADPGASAARCRRRSSRPAGEPIS